MFSSKRNAKCTAITVTYNSSATIVPLMDSLASQAHADIELIIVDNGSSDNTLKVIAEFQKNSSLVIKVIESVNKGFAGGYEVARRSLVEHGKPLLCVNPDVVLHPDAVARLCETLETNDRVAVATTSLVDTSGVEDSASRRTLPRLGSAAAYAALGRLLPRPLRYNAKSKNTEVLGHLGDGSPVVSVEATTGALMMMSPAFRDGTTEIFDTDYWMYGEDLQLCKEVRDANMKVALVEGPPSVHLKGASSGWPRSPLSNRAFHRAMFLYYKKNLRRNAVEQIVVSAGVTCRLVLSLALANFATSSRKVKS